MRPRSKQLALTRQVQALDIDTTITHNPSGSQARIQIPSGTLPNGTVVSVRYFKDVTRQRSVIGETNNYFFSVVVSWLLGTGPTATVPDTFLMKTAFRSQSQ
jgi:hypothetical protein